tara:strand:+ start:6028 stop:6291 length:264 start_codon:yes stop_codon:yes gene_type:complete
MGKAKVKVIGEMVEIPRLDLSKLTTDCHGVEYISEESTVVYTDVARGHTMVDIFDLYHDDGKKVRRIWVLGGKLSPKLGTPEIVIKQ